MVTKAQKPSNPKFNVLPQQPLTTAKHVSRLNTLFCTTGRMWNN